MPSKSKIEKLTQMAQYGTGPEAATARRRLQKLGYNVTSKKETSQALVPYSGGGAVSTVVDGAATAAMASPIPWMKILGAGVDLVKNNWDWIGPGIKKGASWLWNKVVGKFTKPKKDVIVNPRLPGIIKPLPKPIKDAIDAKIKAETKDVPKDIVVLPSSVVAPGQGVVVAQSLSPAETMVTEQASVYPNSLANLLVRNPNRSYEGSLPMQSSLFTSARRRMGSNAGIFDSFISPGRYRARRSVRIY